MTLPFGVPGGRGGAIPRVAPGAMNSSTPLGLGGLRHGSPFDTTQGNYLQP